MFPRFENQSIIHSPERRRKFATFIGNDYFFNYFNNGIDFLFDGYEHRIKKIILHTNLITKPDFGRYSKCHFKIICKDSNGMEFFITPQTKWENIEKIFGSAEHFVLNHGSEQNNVLIRTSHVYAFQGILFEVS